MRWVIAVLMAPLGCSSVDAPPSSTGSCIPGRQAACTCTDASNGSQTCKADGTGFEACVCDDSSSSATGVGGTEPASAGVGGVSAAGGSGQGGAGASGSGGGDGGSGGAGGEPPALCPAPDCPAPGKGWNCDPACGPTEPWCESALCKEGLSVPILPFGFWEIRVPPVKKQHPACVTCGPEGTLWGIRVKTQAGTGGFCIQWDAPASGFVTDAANGPLCGSKNYTYICENYSPNSGEQQLWLGIRATSGQALPDAGGSFMLYTQQGGCGDPQFCDGGCNGAGDQSGP